MFETIEEFRKHIQDYNQTILEIDERLASEIPEDDKKIYRKLKNQCKKEISELQRDIRLLSNGECDKLPGWN